MSSTAPLSHLFELAHGGIGTVSLALRREGRFSRVYAVKRLHEHLRRDADCCEMFLEEARIAGQLRHANVAGVLDVGEDDKGPFFVMEYVEGLSLRDLLVATPDSDLLPLQLGLAIGEQAARGLHVAHQSTNTEGVSLHLVHRDVSPHNLLIGYDGVVRVADFGIAKVRDSDHQTSTGVLKGKMGYMAPEQLRFEHVDHRSDLFSLGVTLYEAFSLSRLYGPPDDTTPHGRHSAPYRILNEEPPELSSVRRDVPPALEELLLEMLSKDPRQRPQSAHEVAERLAAIHHEVVIHDEPLSIASYLSENFAERREEQRRRVIAAQKEGGEAGRRAVLSAHALPEPLPSKPRRAHLWLAMIIVVLSAGMFILSRRDEPESMSSSPRVEAELHLPASTPAPAPSPVAVPVPVPMAERAAESAESEQDSSPMRNATAGDSSPMRSRRRVSPEPPSMVSTTEVPDGWWTD